MQQHLDFFFSSISLSTVSVVHVTLNNTHIQDYLFCTNEYIINRSVKQKTFAYRGGAAAASSVGTAVVVNRSTSCGGLKLKRKQLALNISTIQNITTCDVD